MTEKKSSLKQSFKDVIVETSKDTVEQFKPILNELAKTAVVSTIEEQKKEAQEKREKARAKREKAKKNKPRKYDFPLRGLTYAQHRRITSKAIIKEFESTNKYLLHIIDEYPKILKELEELKKKVDE